MEEDIAKVMDLPPFLDAEEFIEWWLDSLDTIDPKVKDSVRSRVKAEKCDCGQSHCRGWKMSYIPKDAT
jgi:hypothetical protein